MFNRPKDPTPKHRAGDDSAEGGRKPPGERHGILESFVGGSSVRPGAKPPKPRLADVAAEWLSVILALRRVVALPDTEALRARALELKDRFAQAGNAAGFSAADLESATFALVAFLDETVLSASGPGRDAWSLRPLQLQLFETTFAGEEFFTRLEKLQRERESRIEALEVCYCCLSFGFLGKYALKTSEQLNALMSGVERDIAAVRGAPKRALAPHAIRKDEIVGTMGSHLPRWASVVAFVGGMTLIWALVALFSHFWARHTVGLVARLIDHS